MLINLHKKLDESDLNDIEYINVSNTVINDMMNKKQNFSDMTDKQIEEYWSAICDVFIENKLSEHTLRKKLSKKYDIPYDFICQKDSIYFNQKIISNE